MFHYVVKSFTHCPEDASDASATSPSLDSHRFTDCLQIIGEFAIWLVENYDIKNLIGWFQNVAIWCYRKIETHDEIFKRVNQILDDVGITNQMTTLPIIPKKNTYFISFDISDFWLPFLES